MQRQALRPIIILLLLLLAVSTAVSAHGNHELATADSLSMPLNQDTEPQSHCDGMETVSCDGGSASGQGSCGDNCGAYCSSCQNLFPFRELIFFYQKSTFNKIGLHPSPHPAYHAILHRPPIAISLNG